MAEDSDECEFWLPPQFLSDDDDEDIFGELTETNTLRRNKRTLRKDFQFQISQEFFCCPKPDQSSLVYGSADAECEDEDFVTELTRENSNLALLRPGLMKQRTKDRFLSVSPKSTLHSAFGGFEYNHHGSNTSLNNYPKLFAPQGINRNVRNGKAWDTMDAAPKEAARRRVVEIEAPVYSKGFVEIANLDFKPICLPRRSPYEHTSLSCELAQLKQREIMEGWKGCIEGRGLHDFRQHETLHGGGRSGGAIRQSPAAGGWPAPPLSRGMQRGLEVSALFPANSSSKKERAGTGVFLPRRSGASPETRKKTACSSPFLPAQVVEALNLKVQAMDASENTPKINCLPVGFTNTTMEHKVEAQPVSRQDRGMPAQSLRNQEVWLPEEWTY